MLSDRSYMRDDYPRQSTSALTWLLSSIVAVYVLQVVFQRWLNGDHALENLLVLSVDNIKAGKIWTLATYSFLHSTGSILWIILNLLGLYFIGRALEPMLGARRFIWLYAGMVCVGGLLWLAAHWTSGGVHYGAVAGIAGLLIVFACFYPNQPMSFLLFFVMPVTLKPKWLALTWLGFALLGFLLFEWQGAVVPWGIGPVGFSAQLGGMLAGWVYYRYLHEANWRFPTGRADIELPRWLRKRQHSPQPAAYQVDLSRPNELRAEVDRILDKINSQGFGALTADEKRLLDEARDVLSRR